MSATGNKDGKDLIHCLYSMRRCESIVAVSHKSPVTEICRNGGQRRDNRMGGPEASNQEKIPAKKEGKNRNS